MRATLADTPELFRVRDIDWADPNISRAGVIPIHYDGKEKWIGLGVSKFSASITAIGGIYENEDYDLLETAIREYNEEIGNNLPHINIRSVINCYAIKTPYTIQILLPVRSRPTRFNETAELYNLLWVTPKQLSAMNNHQQYYLPGRGKRVRAYVFSSGVKNVVVPLIKAVDDGIAFRLIPNIEPVQRVKRIVAPSDPKIVTDINSLIEDARIPGDFRGHIGVVITDDVTALIRGDETIYYLSHIELPTVIDILNTLGFRVIVGLNADRKVLVDAGIKPKLLSSIQHLFQQSIDKGMEEASILFTEFVTKLGTIRNQNTYQSIVKELKLLMEYEEESYEIVKAGGVFFNETRACFLDSLNQVNSLLNRTSVTFAKLHYILGSQCKQITGSQIINTFIRTGVVTQDTVTTMVKLP